MYTFRNYTENSEKYFILYELKTCIVFISYLIIKNVFILRVCKKGIIK